VLDRGVFQDMQELPFDREVSDDEGRRGIRTYMLADNVLYGSMSLCQEDLSSDHSEDSEEAK